MAVQSWRTGLTSSELRTVWQDSSLLEERELFDLPFMVIRIRSTNGLFSFFFKNPLNLDRPRFVYLDLGC